METTKNAAMVGDGGLQKAETPTSVNANLKPVYLDLDGIGQVEVENILPETRFLSLNEGERFLGFYQGKQKFPEIDETKEFAVFLGTDGNHYLGSQYKLMQIPDEYIGDSIVIIYRGKQEIGGGRMMNVFDIFRIKK